MLDNPKSPFALPGPMALHAAQWHGMAIARLEQDAGDVPPDPRTLTQGLVREAEEDAVRRFARVHLSGRYGMNGCSHVQEFWRTDMTKEAARELAWAAFGFCPHTLTFYDENGDVVAQE